VLFTVLNVWSSQIFAQNKWQFGVFLTPKIDYRIIQSDKDDELSRLIIMGHNEKDKVRFGLDIGLAVYYNINEKMRFKTGFEFTHSGYDNAFIYTGVLDSLMNNTNYPLSFIENNHSTKHIFYKIPIGFRYTFLNAKISNRPFVEANLKPSFHSSVFNNFNIFWSTSLTLGYTFSMLRYDQLYLGLTCDYFLTEIPESELNIHPLSIGLEIGFIF